MRINPKLPLGGSQVVSAILLLLFLCGCGSGTNPTTPGEQGVSTFGKANAVQSGLQVTAAFSNTDFNSFYWRIVNRGAEPLLIREDVYINWTVYDGLGGLPIGAGGAPVAGRSGPARYWLVKPAAGTLSRETMIFGRTHHKLRCRRGEDTSLALTFTLYILKPGGEEDKIELRTVVSNEGP